MTFLTRIHDHLARSRRPGLGLRRGPFVHEGRHPAPPEAVFPLLCPVREYEWIDGWSCRMVHSASGVAEEDCIFTTDREGHATWVVTRYEPPRRIEFCIHGRGGLVARLKIAVNPDGNGGSTVRWERLYTALGGHGTRRVQRLEADEVGARMAELDERLRYFLTHGEAQRRPLSRH